MGNYLYRNISNEELQMTKNTWKIVNMLSHREMKIKTIL
jgi:hypothetical protein